MYARRVGGKELTFDFAEGLLKDNLLFVDRETNSLWSQLEGRAVSGEMEGRPLEAVPSMQTTWEFWRERHPRTLVMVAEEEGRPFLYRNRPGGAPRAGTPVTTHDTSALGLGLSLGAEAHYFPFRELERAPTPLKMTIGGRRVTIHYDKKGMTAWATDAAGSLLRSVLAYQEGWVKFNPDSRIFNADADPRRPDP